MFCIIEPPCQQVPTRQPLVQKSLACISNITTLYNSKLLRSPTYSTESSWCTKSHFAMQQYALKHNCNQLLKIWWVFGNHPITNCNKLQLLRGGSLPEVQNHTLSYISSGTEFKTSTWSTQSCCHNEVKKDKSPTLSFL